MQVLDENSEEYKMLIRYIANTHASTHDTYRIKVKSIVKLDREGEAETFEKKKSLQNRKLLWHGWASTLNKRLISLIFIF